MRSCCARRPAALCAQLPPLPSLSLQHPNVVGSGYISFPPQQRFEKPLLVQPPTISVSSLDVWHRMACMRKHRLTSAKRGKIVRREQEKYCIWRFYSVKLNMDTA
eukprot:355301-Chlamydomonas_euryale.AAC.7